MMLLLPPLRFKFKLLSSPASVTVNTKARNTSNNNLIDDDDIIAVAANQVNGLKCCAMHTARVVVTQQHNAYHFNLDL